MNSPYVERKTPFSYTLEHGSYYWWGSSGLLERMSDRVAFAFDRDSGTMLKHGAPETVEAYARAANARLAEQAKSTGLPPMFVVCVMAFPPGTPAEDLNRYLNHNGQLRAALAAVGWVFKADDNLFPET